jgi:GntP family gluconate:H+ symporter
MNPLLILLIGMAVVVGGILVLRLHAFLALLAGAIVVLALTPAPAVSPAKVPATGPASAPVMKTAPAPKGLGERLGEAFGKTAGGVGILVAMASVLGRALMDSGAAERIVHSTRRLLGDRRSPLAFLISGFVLGNLVFAETVFYLLIPIAKVMRARSGRDYALYVLCIVAGATMTHSLVPPTPGPSFAANEFKVSFAMMIPAGMIVGAFAASAGYLYARWANRRWDIPLRDIEALADATGQAERPPLPPLWVALLPIVLPVALIATAAYCDARHVQGAAANFLRTVGDKNIALTISAGVGLLIVAAQRRRDARQTTAAVGEALAGAGVIILIIAAGGAFGQALRDTGVAGALKELLPRSQHALIPLAFLASAVIRTAQGSATVAMITAAGIVAPIAAAAPLPFHPVYLAVAVGCGSKPFMWMNDSGFWIIGRMSGFTEAETLKTASTMMVVEATVGLVVTMAGAWLLPMV